MLANSQGKYELNMIECIYRTIFRPGHIIIMSMMNDIAT